MTWWTRLRRRRRLDRDLTDELAFHRAMRAGDTSAPSFGNETQIRETTRDLWRFQWLETTWHDVRYALRALRRQPGFTAIIVITLALGIGANTAVFSVVNGVMLRPLAYPEAERLEFVMTQFPGLGFDRFTMSLPEFLEFREHNRAFQSTGAYATGIVTLGRDDPSRQKGAAVTADLMPTLGIRPLLGRWFEPDDSRPGADRVVLLSAALWQTAFGSDPAVVGRRIDINSRPVLVVGVMPRGFDIHDEKLMLWLPVEIDPAALPTTRSDHFLNVIARRKAGVSPVQAQADIDRLVSGWREITAQGHVPQAPGHRLAMTPLLDDVVGDVRGTLWILQGAVGVVLLIACVNLANLLIARADSRSREHALRAALGASRWRLLRQMTTEGLVLAALAALIGTSLAQGAVSVMLSSYPDALPRIGDIALDWRVLGFTISITLVIAVVFGLVPFAHLAKDQISLALRFASHRTTSGTARARVRTALIVSEVALAVLVVAGAGLLLRSFVNLTKVDVGFNRSELSTFALSLPGSRYDSAARANFYDTLLATVRALPGVEHAAVMTGLPTQRSANASDTDFAHLPETQGGTDGPPENVDYYQVASLGFTDTLGVPIVAGRAFQPADVGGAPAVMVNETLVRRFFAGRNPIGQRLKRGFNNDVPWFTIVGVVRDIKHQGVAADVGTEVYFLAEQLQRLAGDTPGSMYVVVRSSLPLSSLAPQFRQVVAELDRSLPVTEMQTMDDAIGASIARPQFLLLLLGLMAGLALVLAAVGIYGVLAYIVAERRQEIGIRMALGATRQSVVRIVLTRSLGATVAGLLCGIAASYGLTGVMTSLLFEVAPNDPLTFASVCGVILLVATGASVVPAWRASRVNPITALRS